MRSKGTLRLNNDLRVPRASRLPMAEKHCEVETGRIENDATKRNLLRERAHAPSSLVRFSVNQGTAWNFLTRSGAITYMLTHGFTAWVHGVKRIYLPSVVLDLPFTPTGTGEPELFMKFL